VTTQPIDDLLLSCSTLVCQIVASLVLALCLAIGFSLSYLQFLVEYRLWEFCTVQLGPPYIQKSQLLSILYVATIWKIEDGQIPEKEFWSDTSRTCR